MNRFVPFILNISDWLHTKVENIGFDRSVYLFVVKIRL